jgi:Flp pilus assembly protein TadD
MLLPFAVLLLADSCHDGADAVRRRDFNAAEPLLTRCVQSSSATLEAFVLLCGVYQAQGKADALAQTSLEAIKRFPEDKRFYLSAGTIAGRQKKFKDAIAVLESAVKRWPEDEKLRSLLASSYFGRGTELLDAGNNEDAVRDLKRATELAPADAEAYLNLGRALHNALRYEDALAAFAKAGPVPLIHFHRGLALYSLGEFEKSVAEINAQIAADAGYPPSYLVRGMARLAKGEFAEAAPDLEKAAAEMPNDANAQMSCARALVQLGRLADAEPRLRKAIDLDPANPAPVNTLVSVLVRLDRAEEARALARHAAELARRKR